MTHSNYLIIVVTYNGENYIDTFIEQSKGVDISRFIVVDNASEDETVRVLKDKYPRIKIIENDRNLGFGQANNRGIEYGLKNGFDYFVLLNQDACISDKNILILTNFLAKTPDAGIASPVHLTWGDKLDFMFASYLKRNAIVLDKNKDIYPIPFVNAAIWIVPKKTFLKVGGFDPMFFHYGEDTDYANRVSYHRLKIFIIKNAIAWHYRNQKSKQYDFQDYLNSRRRIATIILKKLDTTLPHAYARFSYFMFTKALVLIKAEKSFTKLYKFIKLWFFLHLMIPKIAQYRRRTSKSGPVFLEYDIK